MYMLTLSWGIVQGSTQLTEHLGEVELTLLKNFAENAQKCLFFYYFGGHSQQNPHKCYLLYYQD